MRFFVLFTLSVFSVLSGFHHAYARDFNTLSESAFDFCEKYNPGHSPRARQEFELWIRELSALIKNEETNSSQIPVWERFLYGDKKLKCGDESGNYPFFIDDVLQSRKGSPLGITVLWAALAERLKIPFHVALSPKQPFMRYGEGGGSSCFSPDNPGRSHEITYFALSSGIPSAVQMRMIEKSSYFRPLSVKQIMALYKQSLAASMARAGRPDKAKQLLFECKREFPEAAQFAAEQGRLFLESGDAASARTEFEEAMALFPYDPLVLKSLAGIAWQSGNLTQVREYSERILEMNPDDVEALRSVIKIKVLRDGPRAAEPDIQRLAGLRPEDPEAMLFRGILLYSGGHETAASDIFKKVMMKNSNQPDALAVYGLHYFLLGAYGSEGYFWKSMEYLRKAEEINQDSWMTRYLIGLIYLYTQQYGRAKGEFTSILKDTPRSPDVLLRLARALAELGEFSEAGARIAEAENVEPDTPPVRFAKALLYFRQVRLKEAIREMELAVQNAPYLERNLWRLVLADICIESNEIGQAAQAVEQVLAEYPQNYRANLLMGRIHIERREWDPAESRLNAAKRGAKENGEALRLLSRAAFGRGETDKAWHYIRAAQRIGTQDPELMAELRKVSKEPKSKKVEHVVVAE